MSVLYTTRSVKQILFWFFVFLFFFADYHLLCKANSRIRNTIKKKLLNLSHSRMCHTVADARREGIREILPTQMLK